MVKRIKIPVMFLGGLLFFWWAFLLFARNNTEDAHLYSKHAYCQNTSKIYADLGELAEKRQDFPQAIKHYTTALNFQSDNDITKKLDACYKFLNTTRIT